MIKKLHLKSWLLLLCMIVGAGTAWAEEVTFNFSELASANGWENGKAYTPVVITPITLSAEGGGNNAKYYTSDTSWRMYNGGKVNITAAEGYEVTAVSSTPSQTFTISNGSASLSCSATIRFTEIVVTYAASSTAEKCATPTFSLEENYYKGAQNVTISTATEGATIYYTTDGSTPSTSSNSGTTVTISETCTLKAIAVKEGLNESALGSATYAIVANAGTKDEPFTVADARNILTAFPSKTFDDVCVSGIISQIDSYNSTYKSITYWISDDGTTKDQFEVYSGKGLNGADFNAVTDLIVGSEVTVKGKIKKYNSTYEFDVSSEIVSLTPPRYPVINVVDDEIELEHNDTNGEIAYTITNPTTGVNLTAATEANWISNITVGEGSVTFTTTANEGTEDRTATITLSYTGAESKTVTVTQKHYVADYATLPFEFDGGLADIANKAGLTQSGLGSDYSSSPKLKFDGTGDYVILHFNERPGTLNYTIKGNGFSSGSTSTFKVQTSENGTTWSDLKTYTSLNTESESISDMGENVRYIKWIYTEKGATSGGNVALGNIKLAAYVAPQTYTLTIPTTDNVTISAVYGEEIIEEGQNAEIEQNTEIILTVDAAEGYELKSLTVTGPDGQSFTPQAVADTEGAYKFTMPSYNATISVNVEEYVAPTTATYVLATEVVSGKQYVIASGTSGDVKVMGDQNSNNRAAVDATIGEDGKLSVSEDYEFVIESTTIDEKSGYSIFDASENGGYLYAASSGSNHLKTQVKNNANGLWTIEFDTESGVASIVAQGTNTRNVMQYNNGSNLFSCYGSASQDPVYLFEKVEDTPQPETIEVKIGETATGADDAYYSSVYYSDKALKVPAGVECLTYKVDNGALTVSKTYNAGDVIPADEAVVIKASAYGTVTFPVTTATADKDDDSQLKGVDEATTISGGTDYKFYKLTLNSAGAAGTAGFYWDKNSNNGSTINAAAHKCYLQVDANQVGAKSFVFGDETDGIDQIEMGQSCNAEIYNLSGQRVNKAQKGIYIVNGKKVVVK